VDGGNGENTGAFFGLPPKSGFRLRQPWNDESKTAQRSVTSRES
jgi:hypothetical protein